MKILEFIKKIRNEIVISAMRPLLMIPTLLLLAASGSIMAAEGEDGADFMVGAMSSKPITGEPYELDGNRIVFTNWYFIRPGNLLWLNEAGEYINTVEENVETPVYGPWDAQMDRPSSPYGIEIKTQPAERSGPILKQKYPWEDGYVILKTVVKDGEKYKAWGKSPGGSSSYFESDDGMNWERPILGQKEFNGSKENNLLQPGLAGTVFIDPNAPPEERYKSIRGPRIKVDEFKSFVDRHPDKWETRAVRGPWQNPEKIRALGGAVSPDGIHWKHLDELFTVEHSDGMETGYYDIHLKKYIIYTRTWMVGNRSPRWTGDPQTMTWMGEKHGSGRRVIGRMESDYFGGFSVSEPVIVPAPGETSPSEVFYTSIYTTIPGAPEQHLMFPTIWDTRDDTSSIGLWTSHDGKLWNRIPGPPVLETAEFGQWDGGCIFSFPNLIELPNGDFALPYKGYNLPHKYPRGTMTVSTAYAIWPKGRIVAVEAQEMGGFATVGIIPPGRTLRINALTKRAGGIRVEIAKIDDSVVADRSFEECDIIQGNQFWKTVTWNGESDLGYKDGDGVVIRFQMDRAKLFGIEFQ